MEVKTYTQTLEFLRSYIEPVASTAEKTISEVQAVNGSACLVI